MNALEPLTTTSGVFKSSWLLLLAALLPAFLFLQAPERLELLQRRCLEVCASYPEFWLRCGRQRRKQQGPEALLQLLHFGAKKVLKRR